MKIVQEIPEVTGRGVKPRWPYSQWMDGQIRELKKGTDFTNSQTHVATAIRAWAQKNEVAARVSVRGTSVYVQFPQG